MKNKAEMFKDLSKTTGATTINIGNLTIKNISSRAPSFNNELGGDGSYFERMMREFENLKVNEKEAREEIIKL